MKSRIKQNEIKTTIKQYPYLGKFSDGTVVLFSSEDTGICVHSSTDPIGQFSCTWDESGASEFEGELILSND